MFNMCFAGYSSNQNNTGYTFGQKSSGISHQWQRVHITLPDGVYKLEIRVKRPLTEGTLTSGIVIDDVSLWPCQMFCKSILFLFYV